LLIIVAIIFVAFVVFSIERAIRAHRRQTAAGREELVGMTAEVKTTLSPKGTVFVQGEQWTAISETGPVESGEEVTITKVDGLKLRVAKK
jgi:membrane-bound serine protease (ClpP class)